MTATTEGQITAEPSPLMNRDELAELLGVSAKTLRRFEKKGTIPAATRLGGERGHPRWLRQMITDWIQAGQPQADEWKWKGRRSAG